MKFLSIICLLCFVTGCSQTTKISNNSNNHFFEKWQIATINSLEENMNLILDTKISKSSINNYTKPIFEDYITQIRYEYFLAFKKHNLYPFVDLENSSYFVIELFREDNCNTKVAHIVHLSSKEDKFKRYSFIRSCKTSGKVVVSESNFSKSLYNKIDLFLKDFEYKGGFQDYTGIVTFVNQGEFKCIPLLYLSDKNILELSKISMGLEN